MKLKDLTKKFEGFFSWDKKEIKEKKNEIDEIMGKLFNKRKKLKKELQDVDFREKENIEKKLKAVEKLIKKAKKNLY